MVNRARACQIQFMPDSKDNLKRETPSLVQPRSIPTISLAALLVAPDVALNIIRHWKSSYRRINDNGRQLYNARGAGEYVNPLPLLFPSTCLTLSLQVAALELCTKPRTGRRANMLPSNMWVDSTRFVLAVAWLTAAPQIDLEGSDDDIREIQQEISLLSTCASSYVTQYKASFVKGVKLWIVMEYLGGGSCLDLV